MIAPRSIELSGDARFALAQIVGIMTDQVFGEGSARWNPEQLLVLEARLGITMGVDDVGLGGSDTTTVTIGIDDAALLLDGMAFTEVASAEFAWVDMVRWTSDFVTEELRQHWTDDEWRSFTANG
jgi:hypothetical protein